MEASSDGHRGQRSAQLIIMEEMQALQDELKASTERFQRRLTELETEYQRLVEDQQTSPDRFVRQNENFKKDQDKYISQLAQKELIDEAQKFSQEWATKHNMVKHIAQPKEIPPKILPAKRPAEFRVRYPSGDNKLGVDSDYSVWRHKVIVQIRANRCEFLVDNQAQPDYDLDPLEVTQMGNQTLAYLISNLTDHFQRIVSRLNSPMEVLEALDKIKLPKNKISQFSLRETFNNMFYEPSKETMVSFLARFEDIEERLKCCPGVTLDDETVKHNLMMAVSQYCPSLVEAEKNTLGPGRTIEQMKEFLHLEEVSRGEIVRRQQTPSNPNGAHPSALVISNATKREDSSAFQSKLRCGICGLFGHREVRCPYGKPVCYNCRTSTEHLGKDCPQAATPQSLKHRKRKWKMGKDGYKSKRPVSNTENQQQQHGRSQKPKSKSSQSQAKRNRLYEKLRLVVDQDMEEEDDSETESEEHETAAIATERSTTQDGSALSLFNGNVNRSKMLYFVADSGATQHICRDKEAFIELVALKTPKVISCANNNSSADLIVKFKGDILVRNPDTGTYSCLQEVLFAPNLLENLFSLRKQITNNGISVQFDDKKLHFIDKKGMIVKEGEFDGTFWWLSFELPLVGKTSAEKRSFLARLTQSKEIPTYPFKNVGGRFSLCTSAPSTSADYRSPMSERGEEKSPSGDTLLGGRGAKRARMEFTEGELPHRASQPAINNESPSLSSSEVDVPVNLRNNLGFTWHVRMNHASLRYLQLASKTIPELKNVRFDKDILDCPDCKKAKAKRKPCKEKRHRVETPFHRLWSDLLGPIRPVSYRSQCRYIVTFTDDMSRYAFAYPIVDKTQVHLALKNCLGEIRRLKGEQTRVHEISVDGGREYHTVAMKTLLESERINLTICEPSTPQHVACAERFNLELEEKIRVNFISSGLPTYFWAYALEHVVHIHNRTPNSAIGFLTPFEKIVGRPPTIKFIRRFGSEAYVLDNHAKQKPKFAPRASLGFLLACGETGYTIFDIEKKIVVRSKHVDFVESRVFSDYLENKPNNSGGIEVETHFDIGEDDENSHTEPVQSENPPVPTPPNSRPPEWIGETRDFDFFEDRESTQNELLYVAETILACAENVPQTYRQAVGSPEAKFWKQAIKEEFDAIEKCNTWKLIHKASVPPNTKLIKARWVHKRKDQPNGSVRYRSRLVAKGFADQHSYELSETYAPVARLGDVRFILIVANKFNLELAQLDVRTAFLNGSLEKLVYMEMPDGLSEYLGNKKYSKGDYVCEVHKALYGLKVSPKRWFIRFQEAAKKLQFETYEFHPCLFIWRDGKKFALLLLYVDDILLTANCPQKLTEVKRKLRKEFEITDLGEPKQFLGLEIIRDKKNRVMYLHQQKQLKAILDRFDPNSESTVKTPMIPDANATRKTSNSDKEACQLPYRQAIGSLLYLQNGSRLDIAYATNVISRKQGNFTVGDWDSLTRIFRYLRGTSNFGLKFEGKSDDIKCYVDASLGINDLEGHSTSGFIIELFGDVYTWKSKKQTHVALSSSEAEYVAMSVACRELASVRAMCSLLLQTPLCPIIYEDSKPAIRLTEVDDSSTLKHLVKIAYHYVRQEFKDGNIRIEWIESQRQLADALTKALPRPLFEKFRSRLISELPA